MACARRPIHYASDIHAPTACGYGRAGDARQQPNRAYCSADRARITCANCLVKLHEADLAAARRRRPKRPARETRVPEGVMHKIREAQREAGLYVARVDIRRTTHGPIVGKVRRIYHGSKEYRDFINRSTGCERVATNGNGSDVVRSGCLFVLGGSRKPAKDASSVPLGK